MATSVDRASCVRALPGVLACVLAVAACTAAEPSTADESLDEAGSDAAGSTGGDTGRDDGSDDGMQEDATSSTSASDEGADADADALDGAAESTGDVACDAAALGAGSHIDLTIEHQGHTRTFDLFVPERHGAAFPLVVDMHGWGSSKDREAELTGLREVALARGYAVAYPAGIDASWNAGFCCGGAVDDEIDDVGFMVAMVEQLELDACVDRRRVYATGFSNGGFMAYRLACEAADTFAAIAPVAGVMGTDPELCNPDTAMPVIHFHGTDDFNVAYDGRPWLGVPGPRDAMAHWADRNACAADPVVTFEQDDVVCETWPGCTDGAEVTLCSIDGGGHCWPGNPDCLYGDSTTTLSASARMLDTFDARVR